MHSMELALARKKEKNIPFYSLEQLPYLPLAKSEKYPYEIGDVIREKGLCRHDTLSTLALLPKELCSYIVKKILLDDQVVDVFLKTPFLDALIFYKKNQEIIEKHRLLQSINVGRWLKFPVDKKHELLSLLNKKKPIESLYSDDCVIDKDDFIMITLLTDELLDEGSSLIDDSQDYSIRIQNPVRYHKYAVGPIVSATIGILVSELSVAGICSQEGICSPLIINIFGGFVPLVLCLSGFGCFYYSYAKALRKNSHTILFNKQ